MRQCQSLLVPEASRRKGGRTPAGPAGQTIIGQACCLPAAHLEKTSDNNVLPSSEPGERGLATSGLDGGVRRRASRIRTRIMIRIAQLSSRRFIPTDLNGRDVSFSARPAGAKLTAALGDRTTRCPAADQPFARPDAASAGR